MEQAPYYLLIGNGRVARHFQYYFSLLNISFCTWQRNEPLAQLRKKLITSSHILILITDQEIEKFIALHLKESAALRLHFSGSIVTEHAYGAHPLMSFNQNLYTLAQYQEIPFIVDDDAPEFNKLLPGLPNQFIRLEKTLKPKYHALCVMSGNFSCLLWQKFFSSLEHEFNLSPTIAQPYLRQQMQNLLDCPETALTGPLVRNDIDTIKKNITALANDPFQDVYKSFIDAYQKLIKNVRT